MKKVLLLLALFLFISSIQAQKAKENNPEEDTAAMNEQFRQILKVAEKDKSIKYKTGKVDINSEVELDVPVGFKFMDKADAEYVVYDFWGNPKSDNSILGMVVKDSFSILKSDEWAFVVTYEGSGYVKDSDAEKIDYDQMMKDMKSEEADENKARTKEGFPPIHMIGWAAKPFYDKTNNTLHWAKSMIFGDNQDTTLNYDVRVLGRKGLLSLNAVGTIGNLSDIQNNIPQIIKIAKFKSGSSYNDFNPSMDKVAAYTVGGLVAGKILAKAGLVAILLKNIKLVILGALALFGGFKNKIMGIFGRNKTEEESPIVNQNDSPSTNNDTIQDENS